MGIVGGVVGVAVAVADVAKFSCVFGHERIFKKLRLLERARFTGLRGLSERWNEMNEPNRRSERPAVIPRVADKMLYVVGSSSWTAKGPFGLEGMTKG